MDTTTAIAAATYYAEQDAMHYGPIGADDCPPADYVPTRPRSARQARRDRLGRIHAAKQGGYREPGTRRILARIRAAQRVGITSHVVARVYVAHAFAMAPEPGRLVRLLVANGYPEPMPLTRPVAPEGSCEVCGAPTTDGGGLCTTCDALLFGAEAEAARPHELGA